VARRVGVRRRAVPRCLRLQRVALGTLPALVITALWAVLLVPAVRATISDASVTPLPGFVRGAVDALVGVVNALRVVSPFVMAAALVMFGWFALVGNRSQRGRTLNRLSNTEYAGIDHVNGAGESRPRLVRMVTSLVSGTGLAILAVVLVGATSGIEHEVTNGPLRPIDALTDLVGSDRAVSYVLQSPDITFMDDSSISVEAMAELVAESPVPVMPFGKHLFNLDGKSGLELSVPQQVYDRVAGITEPETCSGRTVIVDDTVGAKVGDTVDLNGVPLRVAKVEDGIAQMNRSIAVLSDATVRDCILGGTSTAYFGALVAGTDLSQVAHAIEEAGIQGSAVSSTDFREHNRDFWRANATPLLLQLILYIALFSGFAAAGERQSVLQRNSREIGMLNATGVDFGALKAIERRRALRTTVKATLIATPLMVPVAAAFNASELGVQIGVGLTEVTVGFSLTLVAMLLASHRALGQFRRTLDLPLAVKG
jgi:hypothetical protein